MKLTKHEKTLLLMAASALYEELRTKCLKGFTEELYKQKKDAQQLEYKLYAAWGPK